MAKAGRKAPKGEAAPDEITHAETISDHSKLETPAEVSATQAAETIPTADPVGDFPPADSETQNSEQQEKKWRDPVPRHGILLDNEGRRMHFSRSNRWQQARIEITAPEGVDPRPSKENTQFLKDHGWRWRGEEHAWTRQLGKNTPDDPYARGNGDKEAQDQFVTLANSIRQRNGLDPIEYAIGEERSR